VLWAAIEVTFEITVFEFRDVLDEIFFDLEVDIKYPNIQLIIDCTECELERPENSVLQKVFYSGKAGRHTVKYEVGVNMVSGLVVWNPVAGAVPGKVHDLEVLERNGIKNYLQGGFVLADKGYNGCLYAVTPIKGKKRTCLNRHSKLISGLGARNWKNKNIQLLEIALEA